jgi:4-amino-4-deoxychorismate lyase
MTIVDKPIVWVGSTRTDGVNAADRGLAFGDGLFETMRCQSGVIPLLDLHLARLRKGCDVLLFDDIELYLSDVIEQLMAELSSLPVGLYSVKLIVTRGIGGRGYAPPDTPSPPTFMLRATAFEDDLIKRDQGVVLQLCRRQLSLCPSLAGIKHLNRFEYVLAAKEFLGPVGAQGLLTDVNGRVVEGLHHNIFLVRRGELITPRLVMCGVAGVMRQLIVERLAPELGLIVKQQDLSIDDLIGAQEVFLCNSLHGIWPVSEFLSSSWGVGAVTQRLQASVARIWCGTDES